jgi:hypothetical protein
MKKKSQITRESAMEACPVKARPLKTEQKSGKLYVTVEFDRPKWQRALGGGRRCRRSFGLDDYGQQVYASCDGHTTVKKVAKRFATKNSLSVAEAELAVTAFMKTLMSKGLVGMQVPQVQ